MSRHQTRLISISSLLWLLANLTESLEETRWAQLQQTEPYYSCDPNEGRAVNELTLTLRAAQPLEDSTITVFGMSGADVQKSSVLLEVRRDPDECVETFEGLRLTASDKCFTGLSQPGAGATYEAAQKACKSQMGGNAVLASIQSHAENELVKRILEKNSKAMTWIGSTYDSAEDQWYWEDDDSRDRPIDSESFQDWLTVDKLENEEGDTCAALKYEAWDPAWMLLPPGDRDEDGWMKLNAGTCDYFRLDFLVCSKRLETTPPLYCASTEENGVGMGKWRYEQNGGSLSLKLCPRKIMAANVTYSIKFNVTNAQRVQSSPSVSIAVMSAGSIVIPSVAVDKPGYGTVLKGFHGGADPLFINTPPGYLSTSQGPCSLCPEGLWCPGGNISNPCPIGSSTSQGQSRIESCRCIPGFVRRQESCKECPANSFCVNESLFACPENTNSEAGSWKLEDCSCEPGKVGGPGTKPCNTCKRNHWCEGGTESKLCPENSMSGPESKTRSDCICNKGFYGDPGGPCRLCIAGYWCPKSSIKPKECPAPGISPAGSF
eukprot:3603001-Rhodomonas_salina.1